MTTTRRVLVIFNPVAGRPRGRQRRLSRALQRLEALGVAYEVATTEYAGHARTLAAAAAGFDIIAVAGGDGVINEVVNGLLGRADPPALAIIPLGTANVLAWEIGLRALSPVAAAEAIAWGQPRAAHLGVANGRGFCLMAGVGFDALVVANVDPMWKRKLGKLAYALETLRQIARYRPAFYDIDIDGAVYRASSAVVCNGRYYGGRYVCAPEASLDKPMIEVCLFLQAGRWHVLRYAWGLLSGRLKHFPDVPVIEARRVAVRPVDAGQSGAPVQGDGDIIAASPVEIAVSPLKIAIIRPAVADFH